MIRAIILMAVCFMLWTVTLPLTESPFVRFMTLCGSIGIYFALSWLIDYVRNPYD